MAAGPLRAFISYSSKDKKLAGDVKETMEDYGVETFLAHEDIRPSAAWTTTIQTELRGCDVFLPLLTDNFSKSAWTDQETGMALALEKLIVPLRVDIVPYGFLGAIQAVHLKEDRPKTACRGVVSAIIEHRPTERERFLDGFIPKFANSGSFDEAGWYASVLVECDGYSTEHIQDVLRAIVENRQIHDSRTASDNVDKFIRKYGKADRGLARKARRALAG